MPPTEISLPGITVRIAVPMKKVYIYARDFVTRYPAVLASYFI